MGIKYLKYFQEQLSRQHVESCVLESALRAFSFTRIAHCDIIVLERKLLPDGALSQTEKPTFINDYNVLNFKAN